MSNVLIECLHCLLKPVVWFCLRRSLGLQELIEAARIVFIKAAAEEMERRGKKVNVSALSVLTGMHRKAVKRIFRDEDTNDEINKFASRVIGQWRHDRRFTTSAGKPRVLSYGAPESDFTKLVKLVSTDLYPKGVLFDLERIGAVERTKVGLKLKVSAFRAGSKENPLGGYKLMARDAEHLMSAIDENIFSPTKQLPHFHGTVIYDNIDAAELPKIKKWLFRESIRYQRRVSKYLARHDLDITPRSGRSGGKRVVMGIFSRM